MAIKNLTGNETLEELQSLLEAFQKRLAILDEKKALTRPEIYSKVRAEYDGKIQEIHELMVQKGADLEEALNQAVVDQDTLNIRKQELKDILDEMDLRLAIGELDEETKAQQTQEHTEELAEIDGKLAALDQKIADYQKLMAAAQPMPAPQPEPPPPEPPKPAPAPRQAVPQPQPRSAAAPRPQAEPVAPHPAPAPAPAPQPRPAPAPRPVPEPRPAAEQAPKPAPRPVAPAPALKPALVQPAEPQPVAPSAENVPNEIDELEKQFASLLGESLTATPAAQPAAEAVEIVASAAPEEPAEESHEGELKCPKCGSFNRADNWYCEKCGNELISAQDLMGK